MKKIKLCTAVLTAAGLAMALSACQSSEKPEASSSGQAETVAESAVESSQADTASEEESKPADTAGEGHDLLSDSLPVSLQVAIADEKKQEPEGDHPYMSSLVQSIELKDSGYDALKAALEDANAEAKKLTEEGFKENLEMAKQHQEEMPEMAYSIENSVQMKRADDTVFSYTRTDYSFFGGAHPNTYITGYQFDSQTGEALTLQDVTADYDGVYEYVTDTLNRYSDEDGFTFFDGYEDTVKTMFYGAEEDSKASETENALLSSVNWFMTESGIVVFFNQYDLAPYAMGQITVEIPFSAENGLLQAEYFN